ncbi:24124_t:CDS:2, partial [Racocetra persica]
MANSTANKPVECLGNENKSFYVLFGQYWGVRIPSINLFQIALVCRSNITQAEPLDSKTVCKPSVSRPIRA